MILRLFGSLVCVALGIVVMFFGNLGALFLFLWWNPRIFKTFWWEGGIRTDWHPAEWLTQLWEIAKIPWVR